MNLNYSLNMKPYLLEYTKRETKRFFVMFKFLTCFYLSPLMTVLQTPSILMIYLARRTFKNDLGRFNLIQH